MSNVPGLNDPSIAAFEFTRMQLCGSLNAVATAMRDAAAIADQFCQLVRDIPYIPGHPGFMPPNGQFLQLPPAPAPVPAPQPPAPTGGKRKLREVEEGTDGKRRRNVKPKDPNAPKRPASSYLMFQNEVRHELKKQHPELPNNELLNLISKAWSDMPKEQKDTYEERQKIAKDHYLAEKAAYEGRHADAALSNSPAAATPASPQVASPVTVKPAAVLPVAPEKPIVTSEDENVSQHSSSDEGSESSEEEEDEEEEEEEEEEEQPPPKKVKSATTPVKTEKVSKHKKNKA